MYTTEDLLVPVSVSQPCGEDISFSPELDAIAAARRQDDPTLQQGEWVTALREADWPFVARRCAELLRTRSKDLRLAAWLAEAQAHTHHFRGLGDGFMLLAGLCERYWDHVHPMAEQGEQEQRVGNLSWLLARTALLVKGIPISEDGAITLADFELARQHGTQGELDTQRRRNSAEFNEMLLHDAQYCLAGLQAWQASADARLGVDGPSFTAARESLQHAIDFVGMLAPPAPAPEPARRAGARGSEGLCAAPHPMAGGAPSVPGSRAQALAQLRLVAEFFRRTEPHSPVAYLAEKAAEWGELPLHEWLHAVVKDPAQLAHLDELLGVRSAA